MNRTLLGVILFTVLEVVTLVVWLILAGLPFNASGSAVLAVVVLTVGLFVEHYVSINVGAGRPPFGPLPPNR
jgi:hypothetical protein